MSKMIFVPPGGFQGFAEQSLAVKAMLQPKKRTVRRKKTTTRRRKKTPVKRARTRGPGPKARARSTTRKKPARLVKGSAAAKRHMAKLRKMRRR